MAEAAIAYSQHTIDERQLKVSKAVSNFKSSDDTSFGVTGRDVAGPDILVALGEITLPIQNRIYFGPISDAATTSDVCRHLNQYGTVRNIHFFSSDETTIKNAALGFADFIETSGVRRSLFDSITSRPRVKGNVLNIGLSQIFMELLLSNSRVFFTDATRYCDFKCINDHFGSVGKIFRALHFPNVNCISSDPSIRHKSFGFVDFVGGGDSVDATLSNGYLQLMNPPGVYVKVVKDLPLKNLADLMAIGDEQAEDMISAMMGREYIPSRGCWGNYQGDGCTTNQAMSSKVRIPSSLVPKLVGHSGKKISQICRDSRTMVSIPRAVGEHVVILVQGLNACDLKTAQYLMLKAIKDDKHGAI